MTIEWIHQIKNLKMDNMFTNSENNKNSGPHRLLLKLGDKISLKRSNKYVPLSNLSI